MTIRDLDESVTNSNIMYCINEYVRPIEHRNILYQHWFEGKTLEQLAGEYHKSLTAIKTIVYGTGDRILLKAEKMQPKSDH